MIREKRKQCGLTQEQIAERLGVSIPAVSKWESGTSYPDITLLPLLARLLQTDLNTLLRFDAEMNKQQIQSFLKDITDAIGQQGFEKGFELSVEKIREFPHCSELIHSCALTLQGALMLSGIDRESKDRFETQIYEWYERAAEGNEPSVKSRAAYMLASRSIRNGDFTKAEQMLALLPDHPPADKRPLQADLLAKRNQPEEAAVVLERRLLAMTNELLLLLVKLIDVQLQAKNEDNAAHTAKLCQSFAKLFELWDYTALVAPLQLALGTHNTEESIALLRSAFRELRNPWSIEQTRLYRDALKHDATESVKPNKQTAFVRVIPSLLKELEEDRKYDFLRENPQFLALLKENRDLCS